MNVMSEKLHSIVKRSDILTTVWLSKLHLISMLSNALTIVSMSKKLHLILNDQMHWRNCLMLKLHLMLMSSDALTKLFDCQTAAFDRETIRCTLTIVCDENSLQSVDCNVIRYEMKSDETALDVEIVECTDEIVWLSDCCIWSWNNQMHVDDCLLSELHLMSMSLNALTIVWCQKNCIRFRTIKCTDDLFERFVDWKFMRKLDHKFDQKKNEKKNEIRFQIIQINVVRRWSTFWLWKLFFFSFIRFNFSKNYEILVFVDWKLF